MELPDLLELMAKAELTPRDELTEIQARANVLTKKEAELLHAMSKMSN